jgi:hypothetical protein
MKQGPQRLARSLARILQFVSQRQDIDADVIERLAVALRCQWGTYWKVDPEKICLVATLLWELEQDRTQPLRMDTVGQSLSISQGNAGHVWRSRKPIWARDLIFEMCLPRSLGAQTSGLKGGIWFAVKTDRAVYGVLEFLGHDIEPVSDESLVLIEQFGISLGRLVEARNRLH